MAFLAIRRELRRGMVRVHALVVIISVAAGTGVRRVGIVAADMAVGAVGYAGVRTGERPNGIVIKSGRYPAVFRMTGRTLR